MTVEAFEQLCNSLRHPMVVVTAACDEDAGGCLVGFHTQTSMDPPRYAVYLSRLNHTYQVACGSSHLMVHFLDAAQHELARHFGELTGDEVDKFAGVDRDLAADGVTPRLTAVSTWLFGEILHRYRDEGDHVAFVLAPVEVRLAATFDQLDFQQVRDLRPGH